MNFAALIELLPDSVKQDVIDFTEVKLNKGNHAVRITIDRLLTDAEKAKMKNKRILGLDCIAHHRYAPEIKKSYFYVEV